MLNLASIYTNSNGTSLFYDFDTNTGTSLPFDFDTNNQTSLFTIASMLGDTNNNEQTYDASHTHYSSKPLASKTRNDGKSKYNTRQRIDTG